MTFLILLLLLHTPLANPLSFISQPNDVTVAVYLPAQFSCLIQHNQTISVTWIHNSETTACFDTCSTKDGYSFVIGQSGSTTLSTVTIYSVVLSDNGSVECIATQVADSASITSTATLTVNDVLAFLQEPVDISKRIGDSVAFDCEVNKGGTFVWNRHGSVFPSNPRYTYNTTSTNSVLTITDLTATDIGKFVCEVTLNTEIVTSSPATLTLVDYLSPLVLQGYVYEVNLLIGPKTVSCPVEGNPLPTDITWSQGGVAIPNSRTEGPYSLAGILQFDTSTESDSGVYTCQASNGLDASNGTVSIEVTGLVGILTRWYVIMGLCVVCIAVTCVTGAFLLSLACCYIDRRKEEKLVEKYDERIRLVKKRRAEKALAMLQRSERTRTTEVSTDTKQLRPTTTQPANTSQFTERITNADGSITYSVGQERVCVNARSGVRPNTVAETEGMKERPPTHLRLPRKAN